MDAVRSHRDGEGDTRRRSLLLAAAVVCLFLTGMSAVRELYRQHAINQEVSTLEQNIQQLEERKSSISDLLTQLHQPRSLDREARIRLGMQKPGERVFVLKGQGWQEESVHATQRAPALFSESPEEPLRSNPTRWARYFFVHS